MYISVNFALLAFHKLCRKLKNIIKGNSRRASHQCSCLPDTPCALLPHTRATDHSHRETTRNFTATTTRTLRGSHCHSSTSGFWGSPASLDSRAPLSQGRDASCGALPSRAAGRPRAARRGEHGAGLSPERRCSPLHSGGREAAERRGHVAVAWGRSPDSVIYLFILETWNFFFIFFFFS